MKKSYEFTRNEVVVLTVVLFGLGVLFSNRKEILDAIKNSELFNGIVSRVPVLKNLFAE